MLLVIQMLSENSPTKTNQFDVLRIYNEKMSAKPALCADLCWLPLSVPGTGKSFLKTRLIPGTENH